MLATPLSELLDQAPGGLPEAFAVVDGFDDALAHGLARLGEERAAALSTLAAAVAATPLGDRAADAAAKAAAGSVTDDDLAVLAGARAALLGAAHDALLGSLDTALGRTRAPLEPAAPAVPAADPFAGARSWLRELAIAGWRGVDHDLVASGGQAIEALLDEPRLRRQAVLLDGLAAELRACCPVAAMPRLPARRWADLWTRALLLARPGAAPGIGEDAQVVSGRLFVLGVDVHEHATAVQVQAHGVLEPAGGEPPRLVRTSVAAAKVDTIVGPALWRLFDGHPVLLGALAGRHVLEVTDLPLLASGDLIWHDDRAVAGEPFDPFAVARVRLAGALAPAVPALDRHPVRIAEPVLAEDYTVERGERPALRLGDARLEFDLDRLPSCGPLTPELVAASTACVGLVRWDAGRWLLQPLAVQATVKRKPVVAHGGEWATGPTDPKVVKAEARSGDAVAVLRERAGRLLRR
ncbi:hypothetical protein DP939_42330 [Spongiactinospora rosea]|uniref:Uncharacterized protein n=1 Tax=Spongiactinospora rosea TaxID=2248750 RepID=A0A366LJP3_9ACTN|nr:hypothetical protein [Spongiactinospora rosea]RBQ14106.1 hypothetical protein DP939_42330 [Spongiactinospora rosea]